MTDRVPSGLPVPGRIRNAIAANTAAQVWTAALALASVPAYIRLLGAEQYGLVSFLASLQLVLATLDLGLSTAATREVSRLRSAKTAQASLPTFIRTVEVLYLCSAIVIAALVAGASSWLAQDLLDSRSLDPTTAASAIAVYALILGVRWPAVVYAGTIRGLERPVRLSVITLSAHTVRIVGGIAVLALVKATVHAFLYWSLLTTALELAALRYATWQLIPSRGAGRFDASLVPRLLKDAAPLAGMTVFGVVIKHADRVIVAAVRPLAEVGYYSVAAAIGANLLLFPQSVSASLMPRVSSLAARSEDDDERRLFHYSSQLVTAVMVPVSMGIALLAHPILVVWSGSGRLADAAAPALVLFAIAGLLNGVMYVPHSFQIAHGMHRLPVVTNAVGAITLVPVAIVAVRELGLVGGAVAWLIFNVGYFVVNPALMHRRLLRGEHARWRLRDVGVFGAAGVVFGGAAWLVASVAPTYTSVVWAISLGAYGSVVISFCEPVSDTLKGLVVRRRQVP